MDIPTRTVVRGPERVLDEYLVILSRSGSRAAFDVLAQRWTPRLLRYAARTLGASPDTADAARDIVQETWLGAIRTLSRLKDPAQFPPWIYAIATRKCADAIRAKQRRRRLDATAAMEAAVAAHAGAGTVPEDGLDLAAGIARLPQPLRSAVHLFYGEDLSIEETAAALGLPAGTVKSRLHHAREVLKRQIATATKGEPHERAG